MRLTLRRLSFGSTATPGILEVDGVRECVTLEDPVPLNGKKVPGETAIPAGIYDIILNMSPRFGRMYPRLLEVPGFTGILIHSGNGPEDTKGCILVGQEFVTGGLRIKPGTSTPAFHVLFVKLTKAVARGEKIQIEIIDPQAQATVEVVG